MLLIMMRCRDAMLAACWFIRTILCCLLLDGFRAADAAAIATRH